MRIDCLFDELCKLNDKLEDLSKEINCIRKEIIYNNDKFISYQEKLLNEFSNIKYTQSNLFMSLSVNDLHQKVFPKYRNINTGKNVVLIAPGPSLNFYKPIENSIHIDVNRACLFDKVQLDYLFVIDYKVTKNFFNKIKSYPNCKKFLGAFFNIGTDISIPFFEKEGQDIENYFIDCNNFDYQEKFYPDLSTSPLPSFWSVTFSALAFALWTNPKKLYLVGCDESDFESYEYFNGEKAILPDNVSGFKENHKIKHAQGWKELKRFAEVYYPTTEIISVNPVGLRGMFKDLYTITH